MLPYDTYQIVLTSKSTADVTITFNTGSQIRAITPLTFTPGNWDSAKTVTVQAVDDAVDEDAHTGTITHVVSSSDLDYDAVSVPNVTVSITDNDTAGVTITESGGTTATEGAMPPYDTYQIVLTSKPTADVSITFNTGSQIEAIASLTFTPGNWDSAQTVTVQAVDDTVQETSPHTGIITHVVSSSDLNYDAYNMPSVTVSITDNDP